MLNKGKNTRGIELQKDRELVNKSTVYRHILRTVQSDQASVNDPLKLVYSQSSFSVIKGSNRHHANEVRCRYGAC